MTRTTLRSLLAPCALAVLLLPLLLAAASCTAAESSDTDLDDPAALGALAARIEQEPARADEILSEAGVTRDDLRAAIERTARDPDAARAYRDAFEAALDEPAADG